MRRQALLIGAAAALLGAAVPVANVGGQAQLSAQEQNNAPAPKAMHVRAKKKLGIKSQYELIRYCVQHRLIEDAPESALVAR